MAIEHSGISVLRRRGKEGAVVKELVKEAYHAGQRAYIRDGYNVIGTTVFGKMVTYQEVLNSDMDIWHALRAYQDAERKKGAPIVFDANKEEVYEWFRRDYTSHGQRYMFYCIVEPNDPESTPRIQVYSSPFPRPDHRNCIARFTNFRWRAGYPKGGRHDS